MTNYQEPFNFMELHKLQSSLQKEKNSHELALLYLNLKYKTPGNDLNNIDDFTKEYIDIERYISSKID